jgi:A/G-specific adenine glycosylase
MDKSRLFAQQLLKWFSKNRRSFPWRETSDPYKVLIAEVFLRKTDAGKVLGIYEHFVRRYPGFEALINADRRELEDFLRPLGLYRRKAKELMDLARIAATKHRGKVPHSREELLELPGVGDYIANAVLCFAFAKTVPLVDTNVIRVVTRVFSFKPKTKRARDDPEIWRDVRKIMPKGKARDFNLAMLDLAATTCLPRKPMCRICPVIPSCDYYFATIGRNYWSSNFRRRVATR